MKKTNRIPYIIAGLLSSFGTGLLFTWSYFRAPLNELFPTWSGSDLSMIFSFHNTIVCIAMIITGRLAKKISPRIRLLMGGIMIGAGLACYPFLPLDNPELAFKLALVFYSVISAIGVGMSAVTWTGTFTLWVPERPGLMVGLMMLCYGCCPFVYGAVAGELIPVVGILTTMRILGIISALLIFISLPFVRLPKPADNVPPAKTQAANRKDQSFTVKQMMKTPAFWAMFLFNVAMRSAGLIFADHSASIAMSFGVSALFGMLYSPANGSASLVAGVLVDKVGSAKSLRIFSVILIAASLFLYLSGVANIAIVALIGLIGAGFAFGGTSAGTNASVRIFFGAEYYTENYSTTSFSIFFASLFCYLGGIVVDRTGGSFYGIYTLTLIFGALAFLCTVWLASYVKKAKKAEQEDLENTKLSA